MPLTPTQRSFLEQSHVCVLSTIGKDGAPHSAPMWYALDGEDILMVTGVGSQKRRNMERDPRVAVVVDGRVRPYFAVMVRGTASLDPMPAGDLREVLAGRYLDPESAASFLAGRREIPGAVFRITPGSIAEYGTPPRT